MAVPDDSGADRVARDRVRAQRQPACRDYHDDDLHDRSGDVRGTDRVLRSTFYRTAIYYARTFVAGKAVSKVPLS